MNHHNLTIAPEHYNNVAAGTKTFEIRVNDRAFQKGDTVTLRLIRDGLYVTDVPDLDFKIGDVYPIDAERVVFSLLARDE